MKRFLKWLRGWILDKPHSTIAVLTAPIVPLTIVLAVVAWESHTVEEDVAKTQKSLDSRFMELNKLAKDIISQQALLVSRADEIQRTAEVLAAIAKENVAAGRQASKDNVIAIQKASDAAELVQLQVAILNRDESIEMRQRAIHRVLEISRTLGRTADLSFARFDNLHLGKENFSNANVSHAYFWETYFEDADFTKACFEAADFHGNHLDLERLLNTAYVHGVTGDIKPPRDKLKDCRPSAEQSSDK